MEMLAAESQKPNLDLTMPNKGWPKIASRLAHMDRHEFLDRSRQELSKRGDTVLSRLGLSFSRTVIRSASTRPARFFFAPASVGPILDLLRQRLPRQVKEIVRPV